jgi:hypothetical protein
MNVYFYQKSESQIESYISGFSNQFSNLKLFGGNVKTKYWLKRKIAINIYLEI